MTKHVNIAAQIGLEIFDLLSKYDGKLTTTKVIGILEWVKFELMLNEANNVKAEMLKERS